MSVGLTAERKGEPLDTAGKVVHTGSPFVLCTKRKVFLAKPKSVEIEACVESDASRCVGNVELASDNDQCKERG